jgi:transmembrane sensor
MSETNEDIDRQALAWLVSINDPEFDRWDEFTLWLERDPAHAGAYHRLADAERDTMPVVDQSLRSQRSSAKVFAPKGRSVPSRRSPHRLALALGGVGVLAITASLIQLSSPVAYQTGPGEMRTIALGDADRLVLNGSTSVTIAGLDRRSINLGSGEILLQLREKGGAPVKVEAGDLEIVDVGTVFSVARSVNRTRIVVAEGEVIADPSGAKLHLPRGTRLDAVDGQKTLRAERADPATAGAWRFGQLAYTSEPLANVVEDLTRATGIEFRADASIARRPFTGTLSVDAVKRDPRSLEPLLDVSMARSDTVWRLGGSQS